MRTKIKICGITSIDEIQFINDMGIDYIGFVFAESKRQISIETAVKLSNELRIDIKKVGVFVDHSINDINTYANKANLDIVQVHKNYSADMIKKIKKPVWYALSIKDEDSIKTVNEASKYSNVAGIVTDSYVKGMEGGTGISFNWDLLKNVNSDVNLILAGGLNPDNISDAIAKVKPNVVDISSGVEENINGITKKSKEKIQYLLRKVYR